MRKVFGIISGFFSFYGFFYVVDKSLYLFDSFTWWSTPTLILIWLGTAIFLGGITLSIWGINYLEEK